MIKKLIQNNRKRVDEDLTDIHKLKYFSPAIYIMVKAVLEGIDRYLKGKLIDIGCGHMPLKSELEHKVGKYDTLDIEPRTDGVKFIGSVLDMHMIENSSYDSVISLAVLEHVPDPFRAVSEINRILKLDGIFMLSVPHISRLHELPHDYFRYTEFGIRELLEKRGFKILHIEKAGTLISYLGHQISTVLIGLTWHIPLIKHLIFFLNKIFIVFPFALIDKTLMKNSLMPMNYFCVAQKIN